jgi:hypothetical protein
MRKRVSIGDFDYGMQLLSTNIFFVGLGDWVQSQHKTNIINNGFVFINFPSQNQVNYKKIKPLLGKSKRILFEK